MVYLDKNVADLDRLELMIRVTGVLVNLTPLRVGVGREPPLGSSADLSVIRIRGPGGRLEPYIPGSSIKGVLRSYSEQLVRSLYGNVHDPWDREAMEKEAREGKFCVICGLFGSTELASHVRVFDAYPRGRPTVQIKTGISIDREFGGARPGVLFNEEVVSPGCEWEFRMDVVNVEFPPSGNSPDPRSVVLDEIFKALKLGVIQVGARRSVGMGLIRLTEATWKKYTIKNGRLKEEGEGKI